MKAAQLVAVREPLEITQVPDPVPGPQDAVLRVEAEGVCRSDWHVWMGDLAWLGLSPELPLIMGHEFGGVVEAVGAEVRDIRAGDRVTVPFHTACGHCAFCFSALTNLCDNIRLMGFSQPGGYAQLTRVPNADLNCIRLPEGVDAVTAAAIGCRYMTAYRAVTGQGRVQPGQWVTVFGAGGVGLAAVQIASAMGAQVIAVSNGPAKLEKAKEEGAVATVTAREGGVPEAVQELTGGGAHVSIDTVASAESALNSMLSLRKGGRHVQVGLSSQAEQGMVAFPVDVMVLKELEVVGSLGHPHVHYPGMLALVQRGKLRPQSLVTERIALEDATGVLQAMTDYQTLGFHIITQF